MLNVFLFGLRVLPLSWFFFVCVLDVAVKIMQVGICGYSLQRDPFSLQRAYTTEEKPEATHCSELNFCCSKHQWPEQNENGMTRANVAITEQKNI